MRPLPLDPHPKKPRTDTLQVLHLTTWHFQIKRRSLRYAVPHPYVRRYAPDSGARRQAADLKNLGHTQRRRDPQPDGLHGEDPSSKTDQPL